MNSNTTPRNFLIIQFEMLVILEAFMAAAPICT